LAQLRKAESYVVVGKSVERLDSLDMVLGKSMYAADKIPDDALHLKVLRSSMPHALIRQVRVPRRTPKVKAFITAKDIPGINVSSCIIPDRPLLAKDKVRCIADVLGVAAAEDIDAASNFVESIQVQYEPLPILTNPFESMGNNTVKIHEDGNIARYLKLRKGDVERGFQQAGSFRGFGNPQAHFAAESQMDMLAEKLDLDPIEFRLKNILRPGSVTATGQILDSSVGLEQCIAKVRDASQWNRKRSGWKHESDRIRRGIGIALLYDGNSVGPEGVDRSSASIAIDRRGKVTLRIGLAEYGTGARSGLAQIAAENLGVALSQITLEIPDTLTSPDSGGTFASRTVVMGGNAVKKAATILRKRLDEVAAELLQCDPDIVDTQLACCLIIYRLTVLG